MDITKILINCKTWFKTRAKKLPIEGFSENVY